MRNILFSMVFISLGLGSVKASVDDERIAFNAYTPAAVSAEETKQLHTQLINRLGSDIISNSLDTALSTILPITKTGSASQINILLEGKVYLATGVAQDRGNADAGWGTGDTLAYVLNTGDTLTGGSNFLSLHDAVNTTYAVPSIVLNSFEDTPINRLNSLLKISFLRYFFGFNPGVDDVNSDKSSRINLQAYLSLTMSNGQSSTRYSTGSLADTIKNIKEDFENFNVYHLVHMAWITNIRRFATDASDSCSLL